MSQGCGKLEIHTKFEWTILRKRDNFRDLGTDGSVILKLILN
jgi:hypothetical protein